MLPRVSKCKGEHRSFFTLMNSLHTNISYCYLDFVRWNVKLIFIITRYMYLNQIFNILSIYLQNVLSSKAVYSIVIIYSLNKCHCDTRASTTLSHINTAVVLGMCRVIESLYWHISIDSTSQDYFVLRTILCWGLFCAKDYFVLYQYCSTENNTYNIIWKVK